MAFIDPSTEQDQIQPGQQAGQAPVAAGGAGIGGATKQAAATPGQNTPAQPSAQLSAYLSANAPQANQMAGQVAAGVGSQVQGAAAAINPAVNVYTGQLYTVPTDQAVNSQVATAPSQLTPDQTKTYQSELQAGQNAPNSAATFESGAPYQNLASNIQTAVQQADLWNAGNSPAKLSTALQPYESANATAGDTTLDALLLSGNPDAYSQIQKAAAPAANLQGQLATATTQADQSLQNAIAQDNAATAAAQGSAQTYAKNLTDYLNQATQTAQSQGTAENSQLLSDLSSGVMSAQDMQELGLSNTGMLASRKVGGGVNNGGIATIQNLGADIAATNAALAAANPGNKALNLSSYLTQIDPKTITAQNIATSQQYSDVAALQKILGANAPVEPIDSTTANLAGTAPTQLDTFNSQGALGAVNTGNQVAALQTQANQIKSAYDFAMSQYQANHFGGMSPTQFQYYVDSLNAQLDAINTQLGTLGDTGGYQVPFFAAPNTGGNFLNDAGIAAAAGVPLIVGNNNWQ